MFSKQTVVTPVSLRPCKKEGYMTKEGSAVKSWKRRLFLLTSDTLYYFEDDASNAPKGSLKLTPTSIVEDDIDKLKELKTKGIFSSSRMKPNMLAIVTEDHTLFLSADSEEDQKDWAQSIRSVIADLNDDKSEQASTNADELRPLSTPPTVTAPTPMLQQYTPFGISLTETSQFQVGTDGQFPQRQNFTPPPLSQKKKFFPGEPNNTANSNNSGYNRYGTAPQHETSSQAEQYEQPPKMPSTRPPNGRPQMPSTAPPQRPSPPADCTPERESMRGSESLSLKSTAETAPSPLKNSQSSFDELSTYSDQQQSQMPTIPPKKPERLQYNQSPQQQQINRAKPVKPQKPAKPQKPSPSPPPHHQPATPMQSSTTAVTSNSPLIPDAFGEKTDLDALGVTF